MTASQRKLEDYQAGNLMAAEIIAADPQYVPGSLMRMWADNYLAKRHETIVSKLKVRAGLAGKIHFRGE
jgi:hypothetical protein